MMETMEDEWAMRLFNAYVQLALVKSGRIEREIAVLGDPFGTGLLISGVIDQLQYSPKEKTLSLLDYKTRVKRSLPSGSQKASTSLQLMLYKSLLDHMTTGFFQVHQLRELGLDFNMPLSSGPVDHVLNSGRLGGLLFCGDGWTTFGGFAKSVCSLIADLDLPLVGSMVVHYIHQGSKETIGVESVEYHEDLMRGQLEHSLEFWKGGRQACGVEVEEAWKCRTCQFRDVCVWRLQRCCNVTRTSLKDCREGSSVSALKDCRESSAVSALKDCRESSAVSALKDCREGSSVSALKDCREGSSVSALKDCREGSSVSSLKDWHEGSSVSALKDWHEGSSVSALKDWHEGSSVSALKDCHEGSSVSALKDCRESSAVSALKDCRESSAVSALKDCREGSSVSALKDCREGSSVSALKDCREGSSVSSLKDWHEGSSVSALKDWHEGSSVSALKDWHEGSSVSALKDCHEGSSVSALKDWHEGSSVSALKDCHEGSSVSSLKDCHEGSIVSISNANSDDILDDLFR